eukprot:CAMPEP_0172659336 /NCGR_PEP_ID=MMETSP1074-20121228/3367_1 /TAXON_ID=2916 /ORGANISM="Ceratium fusus, Strain PA161109" /LENGTH=417 /DNA_ID=CAMNT_0013474807 /DNA_START=106 /DNA_END=1359 /DNA_ORIENTATION=+
MKMVIAMVSSTCWTPVLASSVNASVQFVHAREYKGENCITRTPANDHTRGCTDEEGRDNCHRTMNECTFLEKHYNAPGGTKKWIVKNNSIYEQVFTKNGSKCSGAPDRERTAMAGATLGSANCSSRPGQSFSHVTVQQIPKTRVGTMKYFTDSACTQSVDGLSKSFTWPEAKWKEQFECKSSHEVEHWKGKNSQIPTSAVSMRYMCQNKYEMAAFYDAANCAGCPKTVLDKKLFEGDDGGCQSVPGSGGHYSKSFVCANMEDTKCSPQTEKGTTGATTYTASVTAEMSCGDADKVIASSDAKVAFAKAFEKVMKTATLKNIELEKVGCPRRLNDDVRRLSTTGVKGVFTYTSTTTDQINANTFNTELNTQLTAKDLPVATKTTSQAPVVAGQTSSAMKAQAVSFFLALLGVCVGGQP